MKLIFVVYLLFGSQAYGICKTDGHEQNLKKAGRITYSLGEKNCLRNGDCHETVVKETDRCLDKKTVLKFSCKAEVVVESKHACAQGCQDGACQ